MADDYYGLLGEVAQAARSIADAAFALGRRADAVAVELRETRGLEPQPHGSAQELRAAWKELAARERELRAVERAIKAHHDSLPSVSEIAGSIDLTGGLPLQLHMNRLRGRDTPMECGHPAQCLKQDDTGAWACMVCGWNPNKAEVLGVPPAALLAPLEGQGDG